MSAMILVELFAKSSLIAAAGLGLSLALRSRPAVERVDVLRATVCLLLVLPVIMLAAPALQLALLPVEAQASGLPPPPLWSGMAEPVQGLAVTGSIVWPSPVELAVWSLSILWVLGALLVWGRFVLGVVTLRHWTRSGKVVDAAAWTEPLARLTTGPRRPALIASPSVPAPLSWGLPPGVVLIGDHCLARPEQARAVLAHELAHVRRRDWLFLALSRTALALNWFNPLVWRLHSELIARTEDAADASAVAATDPETYARALVAMAGAHQPAAALGMAGSHKSLAERITRIMQAPRSIKPRPLALTAAIGFLAVVATPLAALELTRHDPAPPAPPAPPEAPAQPAWAPPAPPLPPVAGVPAQAPQPPAPPAPPAPGVAHVYRQDPDTIEVRRIVEQARAQAAEARRHADAARAEVQARAPEIAQARIHAEAARQAALQARAQAAEARADAEAAMAEARVHMARGADEMDRGADEMREAARKLRDPAYRARQIEEARARGDVVTDAELQAVARRLPGQADELNRQADRMRQQAREHN